MFNCILFISFIGFLHALEKPCSTCKFFIPQSNKIEIGLCSKFQDKIIMNNKEHFVKNLAVYCRNNENKCGKSGFLYESNNINDKIANYEDIESLCCGEFIEKSDLRELEEIEKDLVDIFQKMRRHNTKRIYKTTKDLYKLFKNKNKNKN
jgi:hypothetical protein